MDFKEKFIDQIEYIDNCDDWFILEDIRDRFNETLREIEETNSMEMKKIYARNFFYKHYFFNDTYALEFEGMLGQY